MSGDAALLSMHGVSKRFGATQALRDVSLEAPSGKALALIGENGAGKSTLMKILSGALRADAGQMWLSGESYRPANPHDARKAGVAMIYQELNLALDLSVEDNIMLGQEAHCLGLLRRREQQMRVRDALERLGHPELRPQTMVGRLSVGAQQLVEIARALVMRARVMVLDEPTSSLPRPDVERLFRVIRSLIAQGMSVIYISHFLEEIRQVCDLYAVLRDGQTAGSGVVAETPNEKILALMVGRSVESLFPVVPHTPGEPILSLESLSGARLPREVSLTLRRGEILGIAGLVGAGRTETLRAIFGLAPIRSGKIRIAGVEPGHTPHARIRAGLGMVSEDRKGEGLAQQRSIADNLTYSRLSPYTRGGWLRLGRRRRAVEDWMSRVQIKARSPEQKTIALSGGNQQKVALARVLHQDADVLLLDEPTRGIDIGAKAEIYRLIGEAAAAGKGVLFVSSYLPELLAVCDRVGVMARGRLQEIRPAEQWTEREIMACAVSVD